MKRIFKKKILNNNKIIKRIAPSIRLSKQKKISKYYKKYIKIIKIIFITLFILSRLLYLIKSLNRSKIKKEEENNKKKGEKIFLKYFKSLKRISYHNKSLLSKYRKIILDIFSKNAQKNISFINNIYINYGLKFGNQLILLNKVIFYCEIIKCKKIILHENNNIYIRNTINDDKFNLTIGTRKSPNDINSNDLISLYYPHPYYRFLEIRPKNKFYIFKNEILKNIPFINANKNDLYIHIRSGDIFVNPKLGWSYAQPPLCFYETIINNNKFNNIYIISENKLNPVINKLLKKYPNIIYNQNKIELDIAYLAYGYNIVGSLSSFVIDIIKLNDNLRKFWEYDFYHISGKIYHFHHSLYKYKINYTIFYMKPSKNYKENMYIWRGTKKQINIMLRDKCDKKFKIIEPN